MGTVPLQTFVCLLLVTIIRSHAVKVSKACYGSAGLECTRHELVCQDGKIAMQDAFLSYNSSCGNGLSHCQNVSVGNLIYDKREEFNGTLTEELYRNCSLKESCKFNAGRNGTDLNFSVLEYICMNESSNICDGEAIDDDNDKSLLWNKTGTMNVGYTCSCKISSITTEPLAVYALDMRPRSACTNLSITTHGETYKNCNQNIQYQMLANTTLTITVEPVTVFDILWLNIRGHFEVNCSTTITPTTTTLSTTSTSTATSRTTLSATSTTTSTTAQNTGAIAGGVVGVFLVCVIVAAVLIWFKFVRNKKKDKKPEKGSSNHVFAGSLSCTAIQKAGSKNVKAVSNYDYATIHGGANPVGRTKNLYVLAGKPSTENETVLMEDDYNHINHNPPQGAPPHGYDTTASAAAAVKKLKNASFNCIDADDYNHLGEGKPSVVSSDYDTTVSASKAVAQLGEMKDSEDDYDHFKRSEDRVIDLPYDTANHHSSISADTSPGPYDLAK